MPCFNEAILDRLEMKIASMDNKDKCEALVFDEICVYGQRSTVQVKTACWLLLYGRHSQI